MFKSLSITTIYYTAQFIIKKPYTPEPIRFLFLMEPACILNKTNCVIHFLTYLRLNAMYEMDAIDIRRKIVPITAITVNSADRAEFSIFAMQHCPLDKVALSHSPFS